MTKLKRLLLAFAGAIAIPSLVSAYTLAEIQLACQKDIPYWNAYTPKSSSVCLTYHNAEKSWVWLYNDKYGWAVYWQADPDFLLTITPQQPIIPSYSGVIDGKVLTKSLLTMSLKYGNASAPGKKIHLSSNRGQFTDFFVPSGGVVTTNAAGSATASINTRQQPGTSTVTATDSDINTNSSAVISWFPAKYQNDFLITCYTIANEKDWPNTPTSTDVCGLPESNKYSSRFLKDVRMQGSGVALDGTTVHYNDNQQCYNLDKCARTSAGACATAGASIAVDFSVIPKHSTVDVAIIGQRKAQDTGGRIKGYHIDEYVGAQPALCRSLGLRHSAVTFMNYQ